MAEKKRGLRNTRVWKRFAAICMAVVMAVTMLPIIPGAKDVYAATISDYTINIKFFGEDKSSPDEHPAITLEDDEFYYVLLTLKEKKATPEETEAGDAVGFCKAVIGTYTNGAWTDHEKIINSGAVYSDTFSPYGYMATGPFYRINADGSQGPSLPYDNTKYEVFARLRHTTKNINNMTYDELDAEPDTIDGYLFLKNETPRDGNSSTISLYKASEQEFEVRYNIDPAGLNVKASDYFYLRAKVEHDTGEDTFYFAPIVIDPSETVQEKVVASNEWMTLNGNLKDEKFTGNEKKVTIQLFKLNGQYANPFTAIRDNLTNAGTEILSGGLVNGYKVTFDNKKTIEDDFDHDATKHVYDLNFEKFPISSDYTLATVLGDAINYGIVAEEIEQKGHSQTNVATKKFIGKNGEALDPNLSGDPRGSAPGTMLIGEQTNLKIDKTGTGTVAVIGGNATDVATPANAVKVNKDKAEVNKQVDDLIKHVSTVSNAMAAKPATITPEATNGGKRLVIDTRGLDPNGTIYIDADNFLEAIGNGTDDGNGVIINKEPNQLIVFNFKNTTTVPMISTIKVNDGLVYDETADAWVKNTGNPVYYDTKTEWSNASDPKNEYADHVSQQVIWNLNSVKDLQAMNMAGGVYLNPNKDSVIQANGASCGWVATAGKVDMGSGNEFHFVYKGINSNYQASVVGRKFVDDVAATAGEKFVFGVEKWDGTNFVPIYVSVLQPDGTYKQQELTVENELGGFSIPIPDYDNGKNYYRIYEKGKAAGTSGIYKENKQEFFVQIEATVVKDTTGTVIATIPTAPKYYKRFNKYVPGPNKVSQEITANDVIFKNETDNVDTAFINITKTFGGPVVEADLQNLEFEIRDVNKPNDVIATLKLGDTTVFQKDANGKYSLIAPIEVPVGATYSVTETNYDENGAKVQASYSVDGGTTYTKGNEAAVPFATTDKDATKTLDFKDVYPGTAPTISKLTLGGTELEGAILTLTGKVGTADNNYGGADVDFSNVTLTQNGVAVTKDASSTATKLVWKSGTYPTIIGDVTNAATTLPNGKYVLHEDTAPIGFAKASDFEFVLKDGVVYEVDGTTPIANNTVKLIDDGSTDVTFSKVIAGTTTELAGATLVLSGTKADGSGAVIFDLKNVDLGQGASDKKLSEQDTKLSWVSGTAVTKVNKLPNGIYTLKEETAPQGFKTSESITFILEDGAVYENNNGVKGAKIKDNKIQMEDECKPIDIEIKAKKTLQYSTLTAGQFSFNLKGISPATNTVNETVTNTTDPDVNVKFGKITISAVGEYVYELTEVIPSPKDPEMTYSDEKYTIKVTVTATATGLKAEYEYKDKTDQVVDVSVPEFINTKITTPKTNVNISKKAGTSAGPELKGATLKLTGTKGTDADGYTGAVVFNKTDVTLGTDAVWVTTTETTENLSWKSGITETLVENLPNGKYTLSEVTVPDENGFVKASDFVFILYNGDVYEVKDDGTRGNKIDGNTVIMVDAYKPVKAKLQATKVYQDSDQNPIALTGGEFEFTLTKKGAATAADTKANDANGVVEFEDTAATSYLTFTAAGTYEYTIAEVIPSPQDPEITYDTTEYKAIVEVEAGATGLSVKSVTYKNGNNAAPNGAVFTNTKAVPVLTDVVISKKAGTKDGEELAGAKLSLTGVKAGTTDAVEFKLLDVALGKDAQGTDAQLVSTTDTTTLEWISGTASTEIKNLPDGTYTLHEVTAPDANGFEVASDITFVLKEGVVYEADGQTPVKDGTIIMVDEYKPVKAKLQATKVYQDAKGDPIALTGGEFEFTLTKKGATTAADTKANDSNGVVEFEDTAATSYLTFTAAGTYEYTIAEVIPSPQDPDITYDTTEYQAIVVVEAGATGLSVKSVTYKDGNNEAPNGAVFTNQKADDVAELTIKKSVSGATLASVKVTVKNSENKYVTATGALTTTPTEIEITAGGNGKKLTVPVGTYTVEEVATSAVVNGYSLITTGTNASVTSVDVTLAKNDKKTATLKNNYERDKGSLKITKTVTPAANAPKTEFKVTVKETNGTKFVNAQGALVDTDPGLTVTAGTDLVINDIPTGNYTITEDETDAQVTGYTLTANGSGNKGVTKGQTAEIALTNAYARETGNLEITKAFSGATPPDAKLNLAFTVTKNDLPADFAQVTLYYPADFTNGKAILTGIPTGNYTVTETGAADVVDGATTYTFDTATVTTGTTDVTTAKAGAVTITNKYTAEEAKGTLTITKSVTVNGNAPATIAATAENKAYKVQVKNEAGKFINAAGAAVNDDPNLTVSKTTALVISDLPLGKYTVNEVSTDLNNVDATLTIDQTASTTGFDNIEFTVANTTAAKELVNVYTYTEPQVDKYEVAISKVDAFSGDEIEGATIVLTKDGDQTFRKEWVSTKTSHVEQLEEGTYYFEETVEPNGYERVTTAIEFKVEKDDTVASGYKVTIVSVGGPVELAADGKTIILKDAPKTGSIKIEKEVTSDTGNKPAKDSFKVYVYNSTKQLYITDTQGTTSAAQTALNVPVTGLTINGAPQGNYTITEDETDAANVAGFTWTKASSETEKQTSISVDANNNVVNGSAKLKNDYVEEKGTLKIKKTVGGDNPAKTSFKVTVKNEAGKYVKADGTLSDTAVLLEVKVSGGLTINNLLAGKYTITEDSTDITVSGYDRTGGVTTTQATVAKGKTTEAELVNNYKKKDTGKISVHVTEEKSGLDVPDATVVITDQDGKKTTYKTNEKGEVVDKDGKIPTVPSGEYTITVSDVPTGYDVKTGEVGKVVVPKDGEGHHEAVIATDRGGIIITVYDEETNEVVSGAKVVVKTPSGEEKEFITDENGQITEYAKKDQFGNYTSEVGEYKYTVTEVPEGYRVTTGKEQTGKVETSKLTELEAKIAPKTGGLDIKVIDQKTKQPVPNATVEVTYPDGTVHEFKTDKDGMIRDLAEKKNGKYTAKVGTYKIKVTKVPEGYSVQTGVETTQTIEVDTLKHHVAEIATATEKTVQTGDDTPITLLIMLMLMSAAGAAYVVIRKRRENN